MLTCVSLPAICRTGISPESPTSSPSVPPIRCRSRSGIAIAATGWHDTASTPTAPTGSSDWKQRLTLLSEDAQREFHNTLSDEFLTHLDKGHGECVLRRPELAKIVANSLWHFDGQRYQLGEFVVMPNHVHLLVALLGDTDIEAQCYSWKKFAATQINRVLGEKGRFWQEESFDHLVRSPEQFDCLRRYIAENGPKAGLRPGEYYHWKPGDPKDVAT